MADAPDRMVYWGNCSSPDCSAIMLIAPHPESPDEIVEAIAEGPSDWPSLGVTCPVCDEGEIEWGGSDPLPYVIRS